MLVSDDFLYDFAVNIVFFGMILSWLFGHIIIMLSGFGLGIILAIILLKMHKIQLSS